MSVYLPILIEDQLKLVAGIHEYEYRSLLGETTQTSEINNRLIRLYVLFFVFDTKTTQRPLQFFIVRAVLHGVNYYRAHYFTEI